MAQVGFPRLYCLVGADARYDLCTEFPNSTSRMQTAKASNPNLLVVMHAQNGITFPLPQVTYASGTYDLVTTSLTDNVTDGQAANVGTVRPFSAFRDKLKRADGADALINNGTSGHFGWNLGNYGLSIGMENTWQALGRFLVLRMKQNRLYRDNWDGYRSDNWVYSIGASWFYGSQLDTNQDGVVDSAGTLRQRWGDGLNSLGQYLANSLPGKIVGGNGLLKADPREGVWTASHTDKDGWRKHPNFAELEDGERYLFSNTMAQRAIDMANSTSSLTDPTTGSSLKGWLPWPDQYGRERYFSFMYQLTNDAGTFYSVPANFNSPSVYKQEIYYRPNRKGLAMACCAGGYYFAHFFQQHSSRLYLDDEMLGGVGVARRNWMGQPIAAATNPANNVFMREFEHGMAIVNVGGTATTVSLPGGSGNWRKINGTAAHNDGGSLGATFQIPAHDGRLFVRVGTTPSLPPVNLTPPVITGTAEVGQALTPTRGTWQNSPTSFDLTFARYSGSTRVATLQQQTADAVEALNTYTLVAGDAGFTIRLEVTATNADGSASAISLPTAVVDSGAAFDRFDGPGSLIFDFTVASESLPSSIFPPSLIFDFATGSGRIVNFLRISQGIRNGTGTRRIGEGGGL